MRKGRQILSSAYGEIKDTLLVYSGHWSKDSQKEYQAIADLFHPKGKLYQFVYEDPRKDIRQQDLPQTPPNYELVRLRQEVNSPYALPEMLTSWSEEIEQIARQGYMGYRRWTQDPFVVLQHLGEPILLQSSFHQRVCDYFLSLELARHPETDFLVKPTELYLEGGNILAGKNCAFIGKDLIRQNMFQQQEEEAKIIADFRRDLGVEEIVVLGFGNKRAKIPIHPRSRQVDGNSKSFQPLFHLDLFMNIGGMDGEKEIVFLASPQLTREVLGPHADEMKLPSEFDGHFDSIRHSFPSERIRIAELPIFYHQSTLFSWNNCLVEIYDGKKVAYLPDYIEREEDEEQMNPAFEKVQAAVQTIFQNEGFQVKWIESGRLFRRLARFGGSLHCVTKVIRRSTV